MTRRLLPLLVLAGAGCFPELPGVVDEGTHVVVAADPGLQLCGGAMSHMDSFVAALSAEFSLAPPAGEDRFTVYWLVPEGFSERSGCPTAATACAHAEEHFTPYVPIDHEFVHNVTALIGDPRPIFSEGIAVAFDGLADGAPGWATEAGDVRRLLGLTSGVQLIHAGGYPTAGAFTSFLVREHGLDAYLKMYAAVGPFESEGGIDAIFREEFGVSLDDSIAAFESDPECGEAGWDAKLLECAAPALAWEGDGVALHRAIACDQDDAVGPFGSGSAVVYYTVEIPEAGDYEVAVIGDDLNGRVSLTPCTICGGEGVAVSVGEARRTIVLEAGRHSLRLHGPADVRTSLGFRLRRVGQAGQTGPAGP